MNLYQGIDLGIVLLDCLKATEFFIEKISRDEFVIIEVIEVNKHEY